MSFVSSFYLYFKFSNHITCVIYYRRYLVVCSVEDVEKESLCVIEFKVMIPLSQLLTAESTGKVCTTILDVLFGGSLALVN